MNSNSKEAFKAVIFDIGGVIVNDQALREKAHQVLKITNPQEFWLAFNQAALPACRGEEPFLDAWRRVGKALNIPVDKAVAEQLWIRDFEELITINQELLQFVDQLRSKVKLGVVSNTVEEHARILMRMGVYKHFDQVILSHQVKLTKDSSQIFEIAAERLALPHSSIIFIDDVERFRAVAESVGMTGLLYENFEKLKKDLLLQGLSVP